jgi:hypothetical protein
MSHRSPFARPLLFALRPLLLVAALLLALATSCFSYGSIHSYRTESGRPIASTYPEDAYLVWHDGDGWHLRARSEASHLFEGMVEGGVHRVRPVGVDPAALRTGGGAVAFSFVPEPGGGEAGFDWQGGCGEFSLYVNGDTRPLRIFAGVFGANPPRIPFALCP